MRHADFDHVIRAAGAVLGVNELIVIGSQALLASLADPPATVVRSVEVDVLPVDGDEHKADLVDGSIGEASMFQEAFGVYARGAQRPGAGGDKSDEQGVGPSTAVLPAGWRDRLVAYRTPATGGVTALCLDPVDLAASKLVAGRAKDHEFCAELLRLGLVNAAAIDEALGGLDVPAADIERLRAHVATLPSG